MIKCNWCGLLTVRDQESRQLCEADLEWRQRFSDVRGDLRDHYGDSCLCFARKIRFSCDPEDQQRELHEERECDRFMDWQMGFSPKEHVEMDLIEKQRQRHERFDREDREWREKQDKNASEWRERQDKRHHDWHIEEMSVLKDNTRSNWGAGWLGLAGAIIGVAFGFCLANLSTIAACWKR